MKVKGVASSVASLPFASSPMADPSPDRRDERWRH